RYDEAVAILYKVIHYYDSTGNLGGQAKCYHNLGMSYLYMNDYPKALECFRKSVVNAEKIGDKERVARNYTLIAQTYILSEKNTDTAVYYQGKALNIYQELKKYESAAIASVSL